MEIVSQSSCQCPHSKDRIPLQTGSTAGPHREEPPTQTPREPQGLSIGPTAELPPEEREGEASGVCAWLQMK